MRMLLACLAAAGLPGLLSAADPDAAHALLERAVRAHGGADALVRTAVAQRRTQGVMTLFDREMPFTDELRVQAPEKLSIQVALGEGAARVNLQLIVDGERGWQVSNNNVSDLPAGKVQELREEAYVFWVRSLVPLLKDTGFKLAALPDTQLAGRTLQGLRVSRAGMNDVSLFFDKETGLLSRIERRARESGLVVQKETTLSGHREFDGAKLPAREMEMVNGKKFTEITITSYRFPGKFPAGTFGRP